MDLYMYLIESKDKEFDHKSLRTFLIAQSLFILQRWTSEECVDKSNPAHQMHLCAMSLHGGTYSQESVHCYKGVVFSAKCICKAG